MVNREVMHAISMIWEYMQLHEKPQSADALIVLGSIDDRVASWAAELSRRYSYGVIVFTGGIVSRNSRQPFWKRKSEAEHFYDVFKNKGGVGSNVLLEKQAQHTGDNATLTHRLLRQAGYAELETVALVTKPYMERRAVATFAAQWADKSATFMASSAPRKLQDYCAEAYTLRETVSIMMKDFGTLEKYAGNGWQAPQQIPEAVQEAGVIVSRWLDQVI